MKVPLPIVVGQPVQNGHSLLHELHHSAALLLRRRRRRRRFAILRYSIDHLDGTRIVRLKNEDSRFKGFILKNESLLLTPQT